MTARGGVWPALAGATAVAAVAAGLASALFLWSLDHVRGWFESAHWLLALLPLAGLAIGVATHRWGGRSNQGMRVVMAQWRRPDDDGIPAPLPAWVLGGTLLTHLFGGSAGREGTAVQMAAGVADPLARRLGWGADERRVLLTAAVAAGFASVFGVPWAGAVFAFEIRPRGESGRRWWRDVDERGDRVAILPLVLGASWLAHLTVLTTGVTHTARDAISWDGWRDLGWVGLAAVAFGIVAVAFVHLVDGVRWAFARTRLAPWLRPAVGGTIVAVVIATTGQFDVAGLSLPLLGGALGGSAIWTGAFALKAAVTALTVGSGFRGGEVTPLFVIGATLGAVLAAWWGAPAMLLAAVGMAATFGAAANAPLSAAVLGVEVFGWGAAVPMLVAALLARAFSGPHHLYVDGDTTPNQSELGASKPALQE